MNSIFGIRQRKDVFSGINPGKKSLGGSTNLKKKRLDSSSEVNYLVDLLKNVTTRLKDEYDFSNEQILDLFLTKTKEDTLRLVPVSIFGLSLAPSEALTKYLKETYNLTYAEIGRLLHRDERIIWANYHRAQKKRPEAFIATEDDIKVPMHIFSDSLWSILESLVVYLTDVKKLKGKEIAKLLDKFQSNIWTTYQRAKKKTKHGKK